ncbi:prolyl oligopeptidase family serine peptidase [Pseudarthrobacter sp. J1763]|uniref:prolyl oligopeptidase family serine peptidase n=1 Tax=Pseudarthrobacter sp. J1763 TaxID=3420445 RepID=UPI003D2B6F41
MSATEAEQNNPAAPQNAVAPMPTDENQWLEDIHGEEQMAWIQEQNARTEDLLEDADYAALEGEILEVLDSSDRIAMVGKRGEWYYNFWRDAEHPKGLWRRTTWQSYQSDAPEWNVLLDIDALAAAEGTEWVWHGAHFLRPALGQAHRTAMIALSPDGGDAVRYREFDVERLAFVDPTAGGFDIPTAKGGISWEDADTLLVSTTAERLPQTSSSYSRTAVRLKRGQSLRDAEQIFEVPAEHMRGAVFHDSTPGFERTVAIDMIDFFNVSTFVLQDDQWAKIEAPSSVDKDIHREWVVFRPRESWEISGSVYAAGSLLVAPLEDWLAGERTLRVLFEPDAHTSLQSYSWTRDFLLLNLLADVSSQIRVLDPSQPDADPAKGWAWRQLDACPPLHDVNAFAVDDQDTTAENAGNDYWLVVTGFLTPSTLLRGRLGDAADSSAAVIKTAPSFFDESEFEVQQHFATSKDGTKVPYFQVGPKNLVLDGGNPTQLSGYGGFEVSRTPAYSGTIGRAWLRRKTTGASAGAERSGVFVVANIRGGGEYGPAWHSAALQANRHRAYEDFAAVATDLIRRGVTSPEHLGCAGGSNGGLLVGNMLVHYPELFSAISCGVPLLDMRRYTKLSAGYSWIAEYGDPDRPEQWEFIKTFSPYHLLRDGVEYPDSFFWTATSDDRVGPVQARKMAARMQAMGIRNVWFHEAVEGGHSGASDNRQAAALQARSQQFLWRSLSGD